MQIRHSDHALQQYAKRGFKPVEIEFVVQYGYLLRNTGVIFHQMREKRIPNWMPRNHPFRRLVNMTVIVCPCGETVITAYLNDKAFKQDRMKEKYNRRVCRGYCGCDGVRSNRRAA